jgi:hypothetical protein
MAYSGVTVHLDPRADRPEIGQCPKEYRDVCNLLIDEQDWKFIPGKVGRKHKLVPPDRTKRICLVPATPSDAYNGFTRWVAHLRRSGALIDENGNSTFVPDPTFSDAHGSYSVKMPEVDPTVQPISTIGNRWWAPESEPEPEPEPAPVIPIRPPGPDHDAKGEHYSLGQARNLLRQGYHVSKVVKQTGWGRNWFSDMIDETGYVQL